MSKKNLVLGSFAVLMITGACSAFGSFSSKLDAAEFWQRQSASSAIYMRGPKAQQMLHQDIANCSNDINELQKLGAIRKVMPTEYSGGNTMEPRTAEQQKLDEWDTPKRDGYLYAEHLPYHDFETCMYTKGWERVEHLPYTDVDRAREEYMKNMGRNKPRRGGDRENVTSLSPAQQNPPPYKNLNQ